MDNAYKTTAVKFQLNSSQPQSQFGSSSSTPRHEDKDKGIAGELSRFIQHTDVSSAKALVMSQYSVRVRQGHLLKHTGTVIKMI